MEEGPDLRAQPESTAPLCVCVCAHTCTCVCMHVGGTGGSGVPQAKLSLGSKLQACLLTVSFLPRPPWTHPAPECWTVCPVCLARG